MRAQTKPVHVYRLCTEGTVEERIQRRAEQKLYLDQMVNRGSTAGAEEMDKMDRKELLAMLKFGADRYDVLFVVRMSFSRFLGHFLQGLVGSLSRWGKFLYQRISTYRTPTPVPYAQNLQE